MAELTMPKTKAEEKSEARTQINACFAEMDRLRAVMKQDQAEINRLHEEIDQNLANIDAVMEKWASAR
jgi:thiamine biosynthesis lipoprotein ApbE